MKKLFLMLAAVAAMALPQAATAFEGEGTYAGLLGGVNFASYHTKHATFSFKPGLIVGGYVGYNFCGDFRAEGELSYRYNKINSIKIKHFDRAHVKGHLDTWSFMANGYYNIDMCWCVVPYIGAGIGYDITQVKSCKGRKSKDENGFAWQVIAGGLYPIDDCFEIGLEYRLHSNTAPKNFYNNAVDARFNWFF